MNAAEPSEVLVDETLARLESDLQAALKRRPTHEARLAGVTRALAPFSSAWRQRLLGVLEVMVRRGSFERPLYSAVVRALAQEEEGAEVAELIGRALANDNAGSLSTLSAACFCKHSRLGEALARAATSRHAHVAFAAEIARVTRGESDGAAVTALAPKIKESHRIALCLELLAPLLGAKTLPRGIAPALAVLREAERHLGRWLVLAEMSVRCGDPLPRAQAHDRAQAGPESARAAWSMVHWALLEPDPGKMQVRPTVELVARLSDRPSADKDTTFLFRLASARVPVARPMLESLAKTAVLGEGCAVRAMLHLSRDYGQDRYREQLADVAENPKRDGLRGLAAACLYDSGETARAVRVATALQNSRQLPALAWSSLIRARHSARLGEAIVTEQRYRRVQLGWVE